MPMAQPCFSHHSLVFMKKCFLLAGADGAGDVQSATLGELHWLMQKVLRAALCRRDQSAMAWLRPCLASQVSTVGELQEQHSNQYIQHLLHFCEFMTNRIAKTKTKKMTQMCWVMLPPHRLTATSDSLKEKLLGKQERFPETLYLVKKKSYIIVSSHYIGDPLVLWKYNSLVKEVQ